MSTERIDTETLAWMSKRFLEGRTARQVLERVQMHHGPAQNRRVGQWVTEVVANAVYDELNRRAQA